MKKLSLVLCLLLALLMLPAASLAEGLIMGDADGEVFDLGDLTLTLSEGDICQPGQKINGEILAIIYPAYDTSAVTHPNMNVLWMDSLHASELPTADDDMQDFAERTAQQTVEQVNSMGIPCTCLSSSVLEPQVINGIEFYGIYHETLWDYTEYTGGVIGETELHSYQLMTNLGDKGAYVFTLTTYSDDQLPLFTTILDTITLK